jgi:hypothetical protein
LIELQGITPQF